MVAHPVNCPIRHLRLVVQRSQDAQRQERQAVEEALEEHVVRVMLRVISRPQSRNERTRAEQ